MPDYTENRMSFLASLLSRHREKSLTAVGALLLLIFVFHDPASAQLRRRLLQRDDAELDSGAIAGEPFGVGWITATGTAGDDLLPVDDRLVVSDEQGRVLYQAVEMRPVRQFLRRALNVARPPQITVYFLFRGDEPLEVTMHRPEPIRRKLRPVRDPRMWQQARQQWWQHYQAGMRAVRNRNASSSLVYDYLASTLARRMGLPQPTDRQIRNQDGLLERIFLSSDDSELTRAALLRQTLQQPAVRAEAADLPLPEGVTIAPEASATEPPPPPTVEKAKVEIESIARHVPQECFYVRFGSFSNYLWFEDMLSQWGGDLRNMISARGVDYGIQAKLKGQLGLKLSAAAEWLGPQVVADVALVGQDLLVHDGPAFGILFQARNRAALQTDILGQRQMALKNNPGAKLAKVDIAGHSVSYLSTPDGRVRSYYAIDGDYHLVTTCRNIVRRFFAAGAGDRPLAASAEFVRARRKWPVRRDDVVFAFLSTHFFEQIDSPHYRIEMERRLRSASDMQLLQLARSAARAEGKPARTAAELIAVDVLPENFGQRPEGGQLIEQDERWIDSLRGGRGSFVPVPDVPVEGVTASEQEAYRRFAASKRQRHLDPVIVALSHRPLDKQGLERLEVDLQIAPRSKLRFRLASELLGPPTRKALAPIRGDLVSLQLVTSGQGVLGLADQNVGTHLLVGLRDCTVPGLIRDGRITIETGKLDVIRAYAAAWRDPGPLRWVIGSEEPLRDEQGYAPIASGWGWQRKVEEFHLAAFNRDVLEQVAPQLKLIEAERPAQVRLSLGDLSQSQLRHFVNMLAYRRARETSASGAHLMNTLATQLRLPPAKCRQRAEDLIEADLICPLGGEYELVELPGGLQRWAPTALPEDNLFILSQVPDDFQFPLLAWFRGAQAELTLAESQLQAHATVDIQMEPPAEGLFSLPSFPRFSIPGFGKGDKLDAPPGKKEEAPAPPE